MSVIPSPCATHSSWSSRPYSLFLFGKLENGDEITKGVVALMFGIYEYLPTLPDPYVTSYTAFLRDRAARGFGQLKKPSRVL